MRLNIIILTLFKTTIKGNFVLYRILQAYSMLDINVTGLVLLAVSIIYTTIVANDDASASVIMAPDADQVNTSIWPGVSNIAYLEYNAHNEFKKNNIALHQMIPSTKLDNYYRVS